MKINPFIFRGYDVRGEADKDLNPEIVEHLGRAYGTFLRKRGIKKAVVGYDCRLTSPSYSQAIIKGLLFSGIDVIDIGLALVGNIYWAQYYFKAPGCVSVSGSHNPVNYNGFKFGTGFSSTMVTEEIEELRQIAQNGQFVQGKGKLKKQDIKEAYLRDLIKRFHLPFKFKVVIDPSHSTAGAFAPELLEKAGCQVVRSHCQIDGSFPIGTPDPTEKKVAERLSEKILEEKADLGFSYDSDGDRIGVVDGRGNILWNDVLVALFAMDVLDRNPGAKIVFNTLCSKMVEDVILAKRGEPLMWRTGHSFIKAKAQKEKAAFAGELSGHFYFLDKFYPHDDGCYSTLALLNYLSRSKKTLSEAIAGLPKYISSPEIKIFCADDKKVVLMAKIGPVLKKDFPDARVIDDERAGDGVRLELKDGMFVIRYSQNGPYLTIKFEAKTKDCYNFLKNYIKELLHRYEEIDWNSKINVNLDSLDLQQ
ncbi:MAG: phosphomannomutase/phosphoglucomutase [Candidatus Nealsonbacteria bacterium]|nr:phosphomannomutase/phosphoglucomutase [Candidatus Nealsonbacteria bacterium]